MTIYLAQASIDENGKISGGKAGNQSGVELNIKPFYGGAGTSYNWTTVFRAVNSSVRAEVAKQAKAGANNKNIGYDQWERNTILTQAKAKNWQLGNITTPCECDCSSLGATALIAAMYNVLGSSAGNAVYNAFYSDGNLPATSTFKGKAAKCSSYVQTLSYPGQSGLQLGDVIISSGHCVIVVDGASAGSSSSSNTSKKSNETIAKEVINGNWGNNPQRAESLKAAGYDPNTIQNIVNQMLNGTYNSNTSNKKSNEEIAKEVINGVWGNNPERKEKLEAAGYDYNTIQNIVNQMLGGTPSKPSVDIDQLARDVIAGKYGNGDDRKKALGENYDAVQKRVNELLKGEATDNSGTQEAPKPSVSVKQNMRGIDVSSHDNNPFKSDTEAAYKDSDFVIVKATQGTRYENPCFDYAYNRAKNDHKCLGTYHYAEGTDPEAEAKYYYEHIKNTLGEAIPCLDWEATQNESFGKDSNWCRKFVDKFHELSGLYPMIYCGVYNLEQVSNCYPDCKLWCPGYPKDENSWDVPNFPYKIAPWESYTVWQFTSGGDKVDRNTTPLTKDEWNALAQTSKTGCNCDCNCK